MGPRALRPGALSATPAGETATTNAALAAHPGALWDCESELGQCVCVWGGGILNFIDVTVDI